MSFSTSLCGSEDKSTFLRHCRAQCSRGSESHVVVAAICKKKHPKIIIFGEWHQNHFFKSDQPPPAPRKWCGPLAPAE